MLLALVLFKTLLHLFSFFFFCTWVELLQLHLDRYRVATGWLIVRRKKNKKKKKLTVLSVNALNLCLTIREGGVTFDALQNYPLVNCYQVYFAHSIYYVCLGHINLPVPKERMMGNTQRMDYGCCTQVQQECLNDPQPSCSYLSFIIKYD